MQHLLRHRTASGAGAINAWDLDPHDHRILAIIQVAGAPAVRITLAVRNLACRSRARGEFAIWSISSAGDVWCVEHGVYDEHLPAPHPLLPDMNLLLANAPPDVARVLATL